MKSLFAFLFLGIAPVLLLAQNVFDPILAPFYHGVASGDALSDKVIIWTRVTLDDSISATVSWKMATDTLLANVVQSGTASTDTSFDFTVKVDVAGLQPDTWYYYQFEHEGRKSIIGRTKTLPLGNNERIRVAVVSCARYGGGNYYHAYAEIADRNDIQAVVHLGDYIYEGSGNTSGRGIQVLPDHETVTLEDYRLRYNTYRLDPDLRKVHQQYPFYTVWDDHETVNDSWYGGSVDHDSTTQGNWFVRKESGQRAYFEWLPIRPKSPGSYSIYREFNIGNLASLIMIDSRLEGRDQQASLGDVNAYKDTNRTILGTTQMQWLKGQLSNSQTRWKIIGNQVMFAPLQLAGFGSYDQWDGYQADRNRIINHVIGNNINDVVVITGDIHTSWANDVPRPGVAYNASTGTGSAFVEFITPSITTGSSFSNSLVALIQAFNPHLKYIELSLDGYFILDLDTSRAQADWYHLSTVTDSNYTVSQAASWYVNDQERFLRQASGPAAAFTNSAPFAPLTVNNPPLGIAHHLPSGIEIYPNPSGDWITVKISGERNRDILIQVADMEGKQMLSYSNENLLDVSSLPKGMFIIRVFQQNELIGTRRLAKM